MQQFLCDHVAYSRISPILFSDFTPARITRQSSNPYLQEHCAIDKDVLYQTVRRPSTQLYRCLTQASQAEHKLKGKYIEVEFAESYPSSARSRPSCNCACKDGDPKILSSATYTASGAAMTMCGLELERTAMSPPLFIRKRTERGRRAFRKRVLVQSDHFGSLSTSDCSSASLESGPLSDGTRDMDVESSVVTYHNCFGSADMAMPGYHNTRSKHLDFAVRPTVSRGLVRPVPFQLPTTDKEYVSDKPSDSCSGSLSSPPAADSVHQYNWDSQEEENPVVMKYPSNGDESYSTEATSHKHQALSRHPAPAISSQLISSLASQGAPRSNDRHHKPLPPPKAKSQGDIYVGNTSTSSKPPVAETAKKSSKSTPDLSPGGSRARSVSFMDCSAGTELGRFPADYLGCRQVDSFIGYADSLAKALINSRPVEVLVYVTSEKLRLAPPKNSSLLFKSFAVKDILSVQKCSVNRRIVCVAVWKSRRVAPQCHVLRCPSVLVSNVLYDSILDQTQSVDDVSSDQMSVPRPRALSDISSDSGSSTTSDHRGNPSNESSLQSPSEFLHKIPAIHIGSTRVGRHDSINDIIQRVLLDGTPTGSREISVWLSLAQLRLVDMSDEREMICESHETSRIRAIGVYAGDKRFIGYIVKEEGKPLVGHVLRCNSAALMVSLVSFLRQACQIMFSQQGGSLYDELSTDDSDTESSPESPTPGSGGGGLMKRLRCIANPHKPLYQTVSQPTFVSHTPPSPLTSKHQPSLSIPVDLLAKTSPLSPLDFPADQYVRFSVTYIGSAAVDLPFSLASLTRSLTLFQEGGVALGRAAVVKNVIQMHISALGINLIDKKHRLFVHRNYPRKQLAGYCRHPEDDKVFAFGSQRPGYPNEIKCHVFRQVQESTEHILEAIHHWLEMEPTQS